MDLNGDGHVDILSGSWPGVVYLFRGLPDHQFADGEIIQAKDGYPVNVGYSVTERSEGGLLIRGKTESETTDEGRFVLFRGKRYKNTPEAPIWTTGSATAVHAADWDGDGDFDLIAGDITGNVYLVPNEGTANAYEFGEGQRLEAGGQLLKVPRQAGPAAADWDGDGDLDLLVGQGDGSVSLFRNTGSATAPKLAAAESLVPPGYAGQRDHPPTDVRRGTRAKICVADWNGDGRFDLLVGDRTTQKPDVPEPTAEEKAEHDRIRKKNDALSKRRRELVDKLSGQNRVRTQAERDKVLKEFREISQHWGELDEKLPKEHEPHGWVWLFVRRP